MLGKIGDWVRENSDKHFLASLGLFESLYGLSLKWNLCSRQKLEQLQIVFGVLCSDEPEVAQDGHQGDLDADHGVALADTISRTLQHRVSNIAATQPTPVHIAILLRIHCKVLIKKKLQKVFSDRSSFF